MTATIKLTKIVEIGVKHHNPNPLFYNDLLSSILILTTEASASYPFVIQAFVPFKTQWSPFNTAVVEAAPASLPFPVIY